MKQFCRVLFPMCLTFSLLPSFLAQAATPSVIDLLQLPPENRRHALESLSDDQFKKISEVAFNDKQNMRTRWAALITLAEANSEKALPQLIKASEGKEWFMRNASLVALSGSQPQKAQEVARKLLSDKALVVRSAAVDILAQHPSSENRDLLWAELDKAYNFRHEEGLWIRRQIVSLLAAKPLGHERALFSRLLRDRDSKIHASSIRGLEKITGIQLGTKEQAMDKKVALWQDYLKKTQE